VPKARLPEGKAADWSFSGKDDAWLEHPEAATPMINARFTDSNETNWKITGTYSVTGTLYMFIARMDNYERSGEPKGRLILSRREHYQIGR